MSKPSLSSLAIASKRDEIAAAKAELAALVRVRKDARIALRAEKSAARALKVLDRAEKKVARIAKLEAKLIALKVGKVGSVAIRTNKRPSACTTVYQMSA